MDHTTLLPKSWDTNWPLRTVVYSYGHLSYEYVANMFAYPYWKRKQALPKVERVNIGHFKKKKADVPLIWWPVVSPTQESRFANVPFAKTRTSYVVLLRSKTSAAHVHAWFSQPSYKKVRYACVYLFLSATDQAKAVRELTSTYAKRLQKLASRTLAKRLVDETTVNLLIDIVCLFCIVSNHSFRW